MEGEYDYFFKIVFIGDAGVGKTSIVRRYTNGVFGSACHPVIGIQYRIKTIKIGSDSVKVRDVCGWGRWLTGTLFCGCCGVCE